MQTIKCVMVGDRGVGKTSLLISHKDKQFPHENVPSVADNLSLTVMIGEDPYSLQLVDTPSDEDYGHHRALNYYRQTDVFLVCFSVVSLASFENVQEKWIPEVNYHCPSVPCLVVGTKLDLRDDPKYTSQRVSKENGESLAKRLGAKYVECSALTQPNLKDVFEKAIAVALDPPGKKGRRPCVIL